MLLMPGSVIPKWSPGVFIFNKFLCDSNGQHEHGLSKQQKHFKQASVQGETSLLHNCELTDVWKFFLTGLKKLKEAVYAVYPPETDQ